MFKISFDMADHMRSRTADWKNPSAYCREASELWVFIVRFAKKKFETILTDNEKSYLIDLYKGHIFSFDMESRATFVMMTEDSHFEHLQEKWEIDTKILKNKVDNDLDAYLLAFLASKGWMKEGDV